MTRVTRMYFRLDRDPGRSAPIEILYNITTVPEIQIGYRNTVE
jgi:hypothetical protein